MKRQITFTILILVITFLILVYLFKFNFGLNSLEGANTQYALGFSYQKFSDILKGMSKDEVFKILGDPFHVTTYGTYVTDKYYNECFIYSREGLTPYFPFGWTRVQVCFDKDGQVISKYQTVFY